MNALIWKPGPPCQCQFLIKVASSRWHCARYCQVDSYVMYGFVHVSRFGYACSICSTRNCVLHRAHTRVYYGRATRRGGRLSCTARLSSSKADVVSTRREYSRTTHRINKIYPWTTHVRLSYFKNLPPHSARLSSLLLGPCGRVDGNFSVAPHRL